MTQSKDAAGRGIAILLATGLTFTVAACGEAETVSGQPAGQTAAQSEQTESERLDVFLEEVYQTILDRSPTFQTFVGVKTDYGKWDDFSDEKEQEDHKILLAQLDRMHSEIDVAKLDGAGRFNYRLFEAYAAQQTDNFAWRFHDYPVEQMNGVQDFLPAFFINFHQVTSAADAAAYISRLNGVGEVLDQVLVGLAKRQEMGIVPPRFVFPKVLANARKVLAGRPFDETGDDSALLGDFKRKVGALEIAEDEKARLTGEAETALLESFAPAYAKLIAAVEAQEKIATADHGVWKLPDGAAYYANRLRNWTTTDMTPDQIHETGLREMARIQDEIRSLMEATGFDGDLQDFFKFMREDEQFFYPDTDQGRERYLSDLGVYMEEVKGRLDEMFATKPKAELKVKRVEKFREASAPGAFYYPAALDGSRSATYFVNLRDMKDASTWDMVTTAYHEAIPGHHMQLAIAQELEKAPTLAKAVYFFGAYTEGWALYAERLAKEMGLYEGRPYPDFGRLSWELWRAARLVVDSGLHHKKWTRQESIDYLLANTPQPESTAVSEVERYIVLPGQATSYKVGMLKILELRARAREQLGDKFDIRAFHDVVLTKGALPLGVLEENVNAWIEEVRG